MSRPAVPWIARGWPKPKHSFPSRPAPWSGTKRGTSAVHSPSPSHRSAPVSVWIQKKGPVPRSMQTIEKTLFLNGFLWRGTWDWLEVKVGFSISVPLAFLQKQKKCLCILGVIKILSKFLLIKKIYHYSTMWDCSNREMYSYKRISTDISLRESWKSSQRRHCLGWVFFFFN